MKTTDEIRKMFAEVAEKPTPNEWRLMIAVGALCDLFDAFFDPMEKQAKQGKDGNE